MEGKKIHKYHMCDGLGILGNGQTEVQGQVSGHSETL